MPCIKQIGTICFLIFPISLFAVNIAPNANSASCVNSTIETYSGHTELTAEWEPNTIGITWYSDGQPINVQTAAQSCTYDGDLTLPTAPTKTGYTFKGWTVTTNNGGSGGAQQCSLSNVNVSTNGTASGYFLDEDMQSNSSTYGLSRWGDFGVTFSYGTITGRAYCSTTPGTSFGTSSSVPANDGGRCWCKLDSFTPTGSSKCNISDSVYVFVHDYGHEEQYCTQQCDPVYENVCHEYDGEQYCEDEWVGENCYPDCSSWWDGGEYDCAHGCAGYCANVAKTNSSFRQVLFGQ